MKSSNEQRRYFQNIADSFLAPTLICSKEIEVLFVNSSFLSFYGFKIQSIKESMNINELHDNLMGRDLELLINGKVTNCLILKLMNRSEDYHDDLYIITFNA